MPYKSKGSKDDIPGWESLRLTLDTVGEYFNGKPTNIGLLLGGPSGNLVDADLEVKQAWAAARFYLPTTPWTTGRSSAPRSHYWYRCPNGLPPQTKIEFHDPVDKSGEHKGLLLELRFGEGLRTLTVPSVHPSGEEIESYGDLKLDPADVDAGDLVKAVHRVAAAALLARHWPGGSRHVAALALAGALKKANWTLADARRFTAPPGRALIKADYSQIELRLAAKIADEPTMIEAYKRGDDLHTLTAQKILGKVAVSKADRQLAKALNFGLLYGMGAPALKDYCQSNYNVELTDEQAREYRAAFFKSYPGLAKWHAKAGSTRNAKITTRTICGRHRVEVGRFTEQLNTPVQGSGADGLKAALALLWERRSQHPTAFPVLAVHDEIVVEADELEADAVCNWLKSAMIDGMEPIAAPVPVGVEATIARTWGGNGS